MFLGQSAEFQEVEITVSEGDGTIVILIDFIVPLLRGGLTVM